MNWWEALIMGIVQGLAEYLPISSSGHLEIASHVLGVQSEENLTFSIVVHAATVLSTIVILWKEVETLFKGLFSFKLHEATPYVSNFFFSIFNVFIFIYVLLRYLKCQYNLVDFSSLLGSFKSIFAVILYQSVVIIVSSFPYYILSNFQPGIVTIVNYAVKFVQAPNAVFQQITAVMQIRLNELYSFRQYQCLNKLYRKIAFYLFNIV